MPEMLKKKLEIAKRAGELEKEVAEMEILKERIREQAYPVDGRGNPYPPDGIAIKISFNGSNIAHGIDSREWFGDQTTLHDALIAIIQPQIDKRKSEIDELIKILV